MFLQDGNYSIVQAALSLVKAFLGTTGECEALDVVSGRLARFDDDTSCVEEHLATDAAVEVLVEEDIRFFLQ